MTYLQFFFPIWSTGIYCKASWIGHQDFFCLPNVIYYASLDHLLYSTLSLFSEYIWLSILSFCYLFWAKHYIFLSVLHQFSIKSFLSWIKGQSDTGLHKWIWLDTKALPAWLCHSVTLVCSTCWTGHIDTGPFLITPSGTVKMIRVILKSSCHQITDRLQLQRGHWPEVQKIKT